MSWDTQLRSNSIARIAGITRVRNESKIIKSTLDHYSQFCNEGIWVFDHNSSDNTAEICKSHPSVRQVITQDFVEKNPWVSQGGHRTFLLRHAMKSDADWFFCFDADERAEIDLSLIDFAAVDAVRLRVFDFYITPGDVDHHWLDRLWMGPEYRDILMLFRKSRIDRFGCREPELLSGSVVTCCGYVRHYGKAMSMDEWERKCDGGTQRSGLSVKARQYMRYLTLVAHFYGKYAQLITWEDREIKGVSIPLNANY